MTESVHCFFLDVQKEGRALPLDEFLKEVSCSAASLESMAGAWAGESVLNAEVVFSAEGSQGDAGGRTLMTGAVWAMDEVRDRAAYI